MSPLPVWMRAEDQTGRPADLEMARSGLYRRARGARLSANPSTRNASGARLEDHVRGGLGHPPDPAKSRVREDLAQTRFPGLRAEGETHVLAE